MRNPQDYPKEIWNRAQELTSEEGDRFLREYERSHHMKKLKVPKVTPTTYAKYTKKVIKHKPKKYKVQ